MPYPYIERDEEKISQVTAMFHTGELLEPIRITVRKKAFIHQHLVFFAFEMGLTHVPIVVIGNSEEKRALEIQYKEKVEKIQRE